PAARVRPPSAAGPAAAAPPHPLRRIVAVANTRTVFRCEACGAVHPRWAGQCSQCSEWNTLIEEFDRPKSGATASAAYSGPAATAVPLVSIDSRGAQARSTGITELDRVLGGGLVPGSVT